MPIQALCPQCGYKGSVPDEFNGKKIKCRQCSTMFRIGGPEKKGSAEPVEMEVVEDRPFATLDDPSPRRPRGPAAEEAGGKPAVRRKVFRAKDREPASLSTLIIGCVAVLFSIVALIVAPKGMLGLVGLPLAGLAMLLAIGGIVMAWGKSGFYIIAPIGGLLVSFVAVGMSGLHTYRLIEKGDLFAKDTKPTGAAAQASPGGTNPNGTAPGPTRLEPVAGEVVDASRDAAAVGPVRVKVTEVQPEAFKRRLLVRLQIENTGTEPIDYNGWSQEGPAQLKDDLDNTYEKVVVDPNDEGRKLGQTIAQTLQPKATCTDTLVFECPAENVRFLQLELPGENLKLSSPFRFKISKAMATAKSPLMAMGKEKEKEKEKDAPKPPAEVEKVLQENLPKLKKPLAPERTEALTAIGALGAAAAPAARQIAEVMAKDGNEQVRATAAKVLGDIGPAAKDQIPALIAALNDDFYKVKANAARALGQMGPEAKEALPHLKKLTNSNDEDVPDEAKRAIRKIDPKAKVK